MKTDVVKCIIYNLFISYFGFKLFIIYYIFSEMILRIFSFLN